MGQGEDGGCHGGTGRIILFWTSAFGSKHGPGGYMPGYGPSSSKDRLCIWVVFASFFVAGLPTEKFQPLLVDRHSCVKTFCV